MEQLIVDLKKIMVKHIRKNEWDKVEYIREAIEDLKVTMRYSPWVEVPFCELDRQNIMKYINIDGHDKIKGDIVKSNGQVLGHCVTSINWEGAYEFEYVIGLWKDVIKVHLIKEPNQNGSLQIKVDGMYVQHNLSYSNLKRGAEEFRYQLYSVLKRYYEDKQ